MNLPKVLVIFPEYFESQSNHYPYWYRLYDSAATQLDVRVLLEINEGLPSFDHVSKIITCKPAPFPFNIVIRFMRILGQIRLGYDQVYIHYSLWSVILCRLIKLFVPITIYYWDCEWYDRDPHNRLLSLVLHWCDVLVTASTSIGEQYRKIFRLGAKRIQVVPNWSEKINCEPIQLNKQQINILFVHRLAPRKGTRELASIIKLVTQMLPNVSFHIVGSGPDEELLHSEIKELKKTDNANVTFYSGQPLSRVRAFFKACDYFIMPSRSEGFPRVILEAMNYRIPFVATKVGNVQELVGETQKYYLTDPKNATTFADKLVSLINSSSQTKASIIKENIQKAKEYSLNNSVAKFTELFKETEKNHAK